MRKRSCARGVFHAGENASVSRQISSSAGDMHRPSMTLFFADWATARLCPWMMMVTQFEHGRPERQLSHFRQSAYTHRLRPHIRTHISVSHLPTLSAAVWRCRVTAPKRDRVDVGAGLNVWCRVTAVKNPHAASCRCAVPTSQQAPWRARTFRWLA